MKKYSPLNGVCSSAPAAVAAVVALALAACGPRLSSHGNEWTGERACRAVDSVFVDAGPGRPLDMSGRATFDVEQYRVRGRFRLRVATAGDVIFEFEGSTILGGHREDIVLSLTPEGLRVLDRERARFYEDAEVTRMIEDGVGVAGDWERAIRRAVSMSPPCASLERVTTGPDGLSGRLADGPFTLVTESGRLTRASWPDPTASDTLADRLDVVYDWRDGRLSGITISLPARGWRVRLEAM